MIELNHSNLKRNGQSSACIIVFDTKVTSAYTFDIRRIENNRKDFFEKLFEILLFIVLQAMFLNYSLMTF